MNKTLNLILKIIAFLIFIISAIWWYNKPGFDSIISTLTGLSAFIVLFFVNTDDKGKTKMKQQAGDNSTLYQSNGPMNIK